MAGSIERLWRLIPRHQVVPVAMLVIGVYVAPDPTRRPTGYGGVLPVPTAPASHTRRPDPLLEQQRRDIRESHGRVLYAPGRGPTTPAPASAASRAKTAQKVPCPIQRVGDRRSLRTSPTA
jgi:hypothetical protein